MPLPVLVIADIHGNLEALKAVLKETAGSISEIWVLGDITGYGPDPGKCLKMLRDRGAFMLAGNHDWAICGRLNIENFNGEAREAALIHRGILSREDREYLASLPEKAIRRSVTLSHGDPRKPIWGYVLNTPAAAGVLALAETSLTLVGHSHIPGLWAFDPVQGARLVELKYGEAVSYSGVPHLANPGSVGQSRDGDPAARYMILNSEQKTIEIRRCRWRSGPTRRKMRKMGFPENLIGRMTSEDRK